MDVLFELDHPRWRATLIARLQAGEVGILPTDTLYGLTCSALDPAAVARVCALKRRQRPCTLVPPSLEWARSLIHPRWRPALDGLDAEHPGATLLIPLRPDRGAQLPARLLVDSGLLGMRWPRHWISQLAADAGLPLITTSVNLTGRAPMTCWEDLPAAIAKGVDFIVYDGPLRGPASPIVHCDGRKPRRVLR